jgi:hypothetical protein
MNDVAQAGRWGPWPIPVAVLAAALLFNLGQGVLRPTLPPGPPGDGSAGRCGASLRPVAPRGVLVSVLAWQCHRQVSREHPHGPTVEAPLRPPLG